MKRIVWKVLAIVFISLFVLETILVMWLFSVGMESVVKEESCSKDCIEAGYIMYDFNDYTEECACGDAEGNWGYLTGG